MAEELFRKRYADGRKVYDAKRAKIDEKFDASLVKARDLLIAYIREHMVQAIEDCDFEEGNLPTIMLNNVGDEWMMKDNFYALWNEYCDDGLKNRLKKEFPFCYFDFYRLTNDAPEGKNPDKLKQSWGQIPSMFSPYNPPTNNFKVRIGLLSKK